MLLPTRELAVQVHDVLAPLAKAVGLRIAAVYGGADVDRQVARLRKGVEVVIATPGRLIDLGDRGELSVADVEVLVLDEADRMADMGFMPQVEWVLRRLERPHQTLLFSATLDGAVDRLVTRYLTDPVHHEVASNTQTVSAMEHRFLQVHQMDKVKVAAAICRPQDKVLVFVRTKRGADRLVEQFEKEGIRAAAIHGDLRQVNRERALADFSPGKLHVLVATDVAARGLHIEGVDVVIHYDPPEDHKAYLHRSGRTARAGSTGVVATLALWNQVVEAEVIQRRLGLRLPIVEMFSNDPRLADLAAWALRPKRACCDPGRRPRPVTGDPRRRRCHSGTPMTGSDQVLVVTAHPDDVDFGAAGTVAAFTVAGVKVAYCIVTDGDAGGSRPSSPGPRWPPPASDEQRAAAAEVGRDRRHLPRLPRRPASPRSSCAATSAERSGNSGRSGC